MPKHVVSSTLTDPAWNATVLGDDWREEVARLRKELDGEIGRRPVRMQREFAGVVGAVSVPLDGNALLLEATGEVLACLPSAGVERERAADAGHL